MKYTTETFSLTERLKATEDLNIGELACEKAKDDYNNHNSSCSNYSCAISECFDTAKKKELPRPVLEILEQFGTAF